MKKILALVLTLTIVLTSFAFVGTTAYAAEEFLHDTIRTLSSVACTPTTYLGEDCNLYTRNNTANRLDMIIDIPTGIDANKYIVYETEFVFNDMVDDVNIVGATTDTEQGSNWAVQIAPSKFKMDDWNHVKVVYKDVVDSTGILWVNGEILRTVNVRNNATQLRIRFDTAAKANNRQVWVKSGKLYLTDSADICEFDKAKDDNGQNTQLLANVSDDGVEEYVDGVYGRVANDSSWYFKRDGANARINVSFPEALNTLIMPGSDVVVEASVYYPTYGTRFDIEGGDGQFVRFFAANMEYGKWTKIKVVLNDNDGEKGTAKIYLDGKHEATKDLQRKISENTDNELRIIFAGSEEYGYPSEGYINYLKVYQVPTGTVDGVESKGLTESSTGYEVDTKNGVIYTTNTVAELTVADLQSDLALLNGAVVRAFSDEKCENPIENLTDGCKVAVETESGIIQLFTLKQKELSVDENGNAVFNPITPVSGTLIVAAYNSDDTLIKLTTKSVSGAGELTSAATGTYYKAFVFDNLTDAKPLVESVSSK